jgi:hypothetical protein
MVLTAVLKSEDDQTVGKLVLNEKQFKTGSKGFFGQGKIEIAGKRYQTQVQLVLIKGQDDTSTPAE